MGGPTGISLALAALSLSPTTTNPSTSPTANPQATLHQRRVSSPSGAMPTRMDRWVDDTVSRVNARPIPYLIGVMVFGLCLQAFVFTSVYYHWEKLPVAVTGWWDKAYLPSFVTQQCHSLTGANLYDVVVLSYPSCGRTWLRVLMGHAIALANGLMTATDDEVDYRGLTPDAIVVAAFPAGTMNVSFEFIHHCDEAHYHPFRVTPDEAETDRSFAGQRTVFLVRDPRDAVLSSFSEMKTRFTPVEAFRSLSLSQWIHNDQGGIRTIISLYNTWEANRQAATQWRMVRYEDLLLHPERELGDLLAWMGFGRFDDEVLRQAVRLSSKEA